MNLNSWFFYLVAAFVLSVVCGQSVFFMVKAYREGIRIGMDKATLNKAVTSSIIFSILPSMGVLVTLLALIKFLGIPFSWLRLTVIGSIYYELGAADTAAQHAANASLTDAIMTPEVFITIAIVMSAGIIMGGILCIFGLKKYSSVLSKQSEKAKSGENTKYKGLGDIAFTAMFIGLCAAYIGSAFGKAFGGFRIDTYTSVVPLMSMIVAIGVMALLTKLQKKHVWLQSFSLSFSMLSGMISAIPFSLLLGAIAG